MSSTGELNMTVRKGSYTRLMLAALVVCCYGGHKGEIPPTPTTNKNQYTDAHRLTVILVVGTIAAVTTIKVLLPPDGGGRGTHVAHAFNPYPWADDTSDDGESGDVDDGEPAVANSSSAAHEGHAACAEANRTHFADAVDKWGKDDTTDDSGEDGDEAGANAGGANRTNFAHAVDRWGEDECGGEDE